MKSHLALTATFACGVALVAGPSAPLRAGQQAPASVFTADQAAAGSGFGLAIVRDLVDVYGGAMDLEDSPLGGLRVRIALPRA